MASRLSEKERVFVEAYMMHAGDVRAACRDAGISEGLGYQLRKRPEIQEALKERAENDPRIASRVERMVWWSQLMRDESLDVKDRLRASEILAKACGDFVVKVKAEVTHVEADPRTELQTMLTEIRKRAEVAPS